MTIGQYLRQRREELHLHVEDVATAVGVNKSTVSRWERGNIDKISRENMVALSRALNIDPIIFFLRDECITPEEWRLLTAYRSATDAVRFNVMRILEEGRD